MTSDSPRIVSAVGIAAGSATAQGKGGATITHDPDPRHPLDAAFARVDRANEHLVDLQRRVAIRERAQVDAFGLNPNPAEPKKIALDASPGIKLPIDYMFSILVGEICYNLRSALDYLVYELAILDAGVIKKTQFPIEKTLREFAERRKPGRFLDGISGAHCAALEKLQPYNGCKWTADLQSISNPDKHRSLVGTRGEHSVAVDVSDSIEALAGGPGIIRSATTADGTQLFVRFHIATIISFADGTPVIEPIKIIRDGVAATLKNFRSEFAAA